MVGVTATGQEPKAFLSLRIPRAIYENVIRLSWRQPARYGGRFQSLESLRWESKASSLLVCLAALDKLVAPSGLRLLNCKMGTTK